MDNRWRFLYYDITELRGHGSREWAGKGKTGVRTGDGSGEESCKSIRSDAERTKVAKHSKLSSGKAAIAYNVPVP